MWHLHSEQYHAHPTDVAESGADGKTHAGALTFVHRFGSSLNRHFHLQVSVFDGVFVERDNEALRLSQAEDLSRDELGELLKRFAVRVARWLRKRGFARNEQDSDSNEIRVLTLVEMLAQVAAWRGTFWKVHGCHDDAQDSSSERNPR